jgi:DNA-binding IscR family transcriptional regulator
MVWSRLRDSIAGVLDAMSLADLVNEARNVTKINDNMYYI